MRAVLAKLDAIEAMLAELRAELLANAENVPLFAAPRKSDEATEDADDFAECNLLEISRAVERFNRPPDCIRKWLRAGDGIKSAGRWRASIPRLKRRLNIG